MGSGAYLSKVQIREIKEAITDKTPDQLKGTSKKQLEHFGSVEAMEKVESEAKWGMLEVP